MKPSAQEIDAVLPQTQCGLCGYKGCMPYAKAMMNAEAPIHLCPPGGVATLLKLGELLQQDATPYVDEMEQKAKPPMLVQIREDECIGCTKCIQACPVDAILGSRKQMHTVISDECTGCELCIPPCPVDCIDLLVISNQKNYLNHEKRDRARKRFQEREKRLQQEIEEKKLRKDTQDKIIRKKYIEEALARAKKKKMYDPY